MNKQQILQELQFKAVRSGGAGGQHVNKVSTKIELSFDLGKTRALSSFEKELVLQKVGNRLTKEHVLILQCDETRSQFKNKKLVIKRFLTLMETALVVPKKRKKTKPTRTAIEKRLRSKQKIAEKKAGRKKPNMD
ncbi:MAG: alternative ribosome rescue aminoacyl-tRNA hydrolase ArfB [Bacteroidota bacterium]